MQSIIKNFCKSFMWADTFFFVSDSLLGLKLISTFQLANKIYIENNLFNAYESIYNHKKVIVIFTNSSFYIIAAILKHLKLLKRIFFFSVCLENL